MFKFQTGLIFMIHLVWNLKILYYKFQFETETISLLTVYTVTGYGGARYGAAYGWI